MSSGREARGGVKGVNAGFTGLFFWPYLYYSSPMSAQGPVVQSEINKAFADFIAKWAHDLKPRTGGGAVVGGTQEDFDPLERFQAQQQEKV